MIRLPRSLLSFSFVGGRHADPRLLVELRDVSVHKYSGPRHVTVSVREHEVLAVVGDPGPAQHDFLQLLAGTLDADEDGARWAPGCRVATAWLEPDLPDFETVGEFVAHAGRLTGPDGGSAWFDSPAAHANSELAAAMLKGIGGPAAHRALHTLDGAEQHRVSLCAALVSDADLVLLENPTRHLDIGAIAWLGDHIAESSRSWVVATHDRALIDQTANRTAVIERGQVIVHDGNFTDLLRTTSRDRLAGGPGAPRRETVESANLQIAAGPPLDNAPVITAESVTKVWAHRPIVKDLSVTLDCGAVVAVIGPHGCGKTTLLELLAGRQDPDEGTVTPNDSVRRSYVAASDLHRFDDLTMRNVLTGNNAFVAVGHREIPSRVLLDTFGFRGRRQRTRGADLSSAERDRLRLALTVLDAGNVLILDDPTGGMEIDMLTSLETALRDFPGTVIISTHDRWLLERVATHIISPAAGPSVGTWRFHRGGYGSYVTEQPSET